MYTMERCVLNTRTSTRDVAETHLSPRTEGLRGPLRSAEHGSRAPDFWCKPIAPFVFSGQPQGLLTNME